MGVVYRAVEPPFIEEYPHRITPVGLVRIGDDLVVSGPHRYTVASFHYGLGIEVAQPLLQILKDGSLFAQNR